MATLRLRGAAAHHVLRAQYAGLREPLDHLAAAASSRLLPGEDVANLRIDAAPKVAVD
jgi:hypothetical protein